MANENLKKEIEELEKRSKEKDEYESLSKRKAELRVKLNFNSKNTPNEPVKKPSFLRTIISEVGRAETSRIEMERNAPKKAYKPINIKDLGI